MNEERKPRRLDIGKTIGWLVLGLTIFGGPLLRGLNRTFNSTIPGDLIGLLVVGLVVLSVVFSVGRALLGRNDRPNAPMPPFGGGAQPWPRPGQPSQPSAPLPPTQPVQLPPSLSLSQEQLSAPRFDPLINPRVLVVGVVGLVLLGALALALMAGGML
ncbi:MAG: hypothetical protein OHK0022_38850 [Roseiflexaceae bacterium]